MAKGLWRLAPARRSSRRGCKVFGGARRASLLLLGALLATAPRIEPAAAFGPSSWQVDADSLLYVKVFKAKTIARALSHNHVIRAARFHAALNFDPEHPAACRFLLEVPVRHLKVDEPWLRKRVGFEKPIDADDRSEVRESMLAGDQLDAAQHPSISITGKDCVPAIGEPNAFDVRLAITVRGKTERLKVRLVVRRAKEKMRVLGRFRVQHADFGIEPYSAFWGAVANAEPIEFSANILAHTEPPSL